MSAILKKVIYDCDCRLHSNDKSYFKTETDNCGNTMIYQGVHENMYEKKTEERIIGLFTSVEVAALIKVLTDK